MWCEIRISGAWPDLCRLQERMAEFMPQLERLERFGQDDRPGRGRISCLVEKEKLDARLIVLARVLDETEQERRVDFSIQVRNREGSEPPAGSDQFAEKFQPIPGLTIQPWNSARGGAPGPGTVLLDPDTSFGTGKHPSTRLCLQLLEGVAGKRGQERMLLDLGCGTGVLAIAALKLGAAAAALAVDIDAEAVRVATDNVELNDLAARITVRQGSWDAVGGRFDLIVANLVPSVLLSIGSNISNYLQEYGFVVAAGFRTGQAEMVAHFLAGRGLRVYERVDREGWAAFRLRARGNT